MGMVKTSKCIKDFNIFTHPAPKITRQFSHPLFFLSHYILTKCTTSTHIHL